MKVAVEGCCHGELDKIYETLQFLEQTNKIKVDVLLICGDFQAVRNRDDLKAMAVPQKYQKLNTFYKYYSGEKVAPVLTIFIGGNHEASNYMQELPYGGWVAKNIYYMGYANVIQVGGLRIGGLSGIFKGKDYNKGHHECPPYTEDTKRSVYHIRSLEVFRLKQLTRPLDIILSHDWPTNVARYGNLTQLFNKKPFLKEEILNGSLGSPPAAEVLHKLQPSYWFSAHLHVKYAATVEHSPGKCTQFLSLDKCLPRRKFLQVIDIPDREAGPVKIKLDPEWLCVLKMTNHLLNLERFGAYMPGPGGSDRFNFEVSDKDMEEIQKVFGGDLTLPENFERTAPTLQESNSKPPSAMVLVNPQTTLLCTMLDLTDPNSVHLGLSTHDTNAKQVQANEEEVDIGSDDDDSDDDAPSDINSSLDTSNINSSLDVSDSFFRPRRKNLASQFSAGDGTPPVRVDDDDEEFKAILAAQRQNSQQGADTSVQTDKPGTDKNLLSEKIENSGDEMADIMAAQKRQQEGDSDSENFQKLTVDSASSHEKSSSDIDSTSQDSQEEGDRSGSKNDSPLKSVTDCVEVSTDSDRLSTGSGFSSPSSIKRKSPDAISSSPSSGRKLKRRNESLYTPNETDVST
ncbi:uncharacterized protein [Littorina saxatilis]|uniref:Lariat debranching enzyme C-terminal domain-containing protein n=1 Tax=Littorina saxatilis TaxID=31220 RepID=A0AAN9GNI8_9CAEN